MDQLIFARVLQGVAGGLLAPLTQMMLARAAGKHMARVMGYATIPILLAPTFGPLVAGAILKSAPWPWLFYINLPIGIIAVICAIFILPHDEALNSKRPFDFFGFFTISPGLACFLYGFERASHGENPTLFIVGVILLAIFIWHAKQKSTSALIDLNLFKNKVFATAAITQFLSNGVMYAGQFLIPLYLVTGCRLSPAQVGWMLAPMGVGMMFVYPFMGSITEKFGYRTVASAGVILNVLGTLPFLWMTQNNYSPVWVVISLLARGVGQGATGIPTIAAAYTSVAREKLGFATTAINIVQRLGGPVATTTVAIVVSMTSLTSKSSDVFLIPFIVLIAIQLLVLISAVKLPQRTVTQ